jgi:glutathione S-transferase
METPPPPPAITLYTGQSPNGIKISITLAELNLPYTVRKIDMATNEQKSPWFTTINPNGRIPALTDIHPDGKEIRIFESGSIMQYLIDRYDTKHKISYPCGSREAIETTVRPPPHDSWTAG